MHNIVLVISYDGQRYQGWQNNEHDVSIEGTLKKTIEKILQTPIKLQAASRTDAGVHAHEQVVNFYSPKAIPDLGLFKYSLNALTPGDLSIRGAYLVSNGFHPTLDISAKIYEYTIYNHSVACPFQRSYAWHVTKPLQLDLMHTASEKMLGYQDFRSFRNQGKGQIESDTMRLVQDINIHVDGPHMRIVIQGENFLYKMVRNLVGTLVHVGLQKLSVEDVEQLFLEPSRPKAGITAPAHGLSLKKVLYPTELNLPF